MSLKSRLSTLQTQAGASPVVATVTQKDNQNYLQERLSHLHAARIQAPDRPSRSAMPIDALADAIKGEVIAEGLIRISDTLSLEGQCGRIALSQLQQTYRLPIEVENDCRRVYIDTETTGLSGGSGTVAFLVGIAIVTDEAIELTQLLITQFSAEAAMLSALTQLLTPDDQLVSYNGKSYDLPLLITRFRMQGLVHPFKTLPHLDLVHPMRRLFAHRWPDCRLMTVEERLLGLIRKDDLPGSQAPEAWFNYLQRGDARRLIRVIKHNHQDIISLAVAHSTLSISIQQPEEHDVDIYRLARWLSEFIECEAVVLLERKYGSLCHNAIRLLAELHRRNARWKKAIPLWEQLAESDCKESIERLAKYHEHISKDFSMAWDYCKRLPIDVKNEHRRMRVYKKLSKIK